MPPSPAIRDAATVLLVRGDGPDRDCFWVQRARELSFAGGYFAMPGGRVDSKDVEFAAEFAVRVASPTHADPDAGTALKLAAIRETFEETGVLLARGLPSGRNFDEERKALLEGRATLKSVLESLGAAPDLDALQFAGRWLTPPFVSVRYDARFFVARMPEGQRAVVWPGELANGDWIRPAAAIERWENGSALLHPPALALLRGFAKFPFPACLDEMRRPTADMEGLVATRIEFQGGVVMTPVRTPTLPPATHTNCLLVGTGDVVVVDPGSVWPEEQHALAKVARLLRAEGRKFREIVLTHHHHDHVDGVAAFASEFNVPVRAHPETIAALEGRVKVDAPLDHDERIVLGGPRPMVLRALHTPGHTRGHLCFLEESSGALLAGDHVAGIGTVIVDPPDGDMSDYVKSLEFLRKLDVGAIYPAHGPVVPDGPRKLDEYLSHRAAREAMVVAALEKAGPADLATLVPHAYPDVAEEIHPLAMRSMSAVLGKLVKEGRAVEESGRWTLVTKSEVA